MSTYKKPEIKIKYDGEYPNLCSGHLEVWVDNKYYDFGRHILNSLGHAYIDDDCEEHVEEGDWEIPEWKELPEDFPRDLLEDLLRVINKEVPHGCCGGCL